MIQAYLEHGETKTAVFELFVRKLPARRGFLVAAGLEQALEFLEGLRFSPDELEWLSSTGRFGEPLIDLSGRSSLHRRRPCHAGRNGVLPQRADPSRHGAVARGAAGRDTADQYRAFSDR